MEQFVLELQKPTKVVFEQCGYIEFSLIAEGFIKIEGQSRRNDEEMKSYRKDFLVKDFDFVRPVISFQKMSMLNGDISKKEACLSTDIGGWNIKLIAEESQAITFVSNDWGDGDYFITIDEEKNTLTV